MKLTPGTKVDFQRNRICYTDNTIIVSVQKDPNGDTFYLVENQYGWNPDLDRKKKFNLEVRKKYLFAFENELYPPGTRKKVEEEKNKIKQEAEQGRRDRSEQRNNLVLQDIAKAKGLALTLERNEKKRSKKKPSKKRRR